MWYFFWILGTLLTCAVSIITALAFEHLENIRCEDVLK
ncbi:cytochrome bd-I oxidase subunit CydX [Sodalis endosymbiont of Henestaris halophilus]|nr:cytochrome bd-I oxidase subunit CydX [Sodalis endosymbiont of Henestaris halophilus]SNC59106.1 Cytochrome bd-I ubiquinol oxidase subunit X [Sodalis endosymbiont of Henestaris halophilus]